MGILFYYYFCLFFNYIYIYIKKIVCLLFSSIQSNNPMPSSLVWAKKDLNLTYNMMDSIHFAQAQPYLALVKLY